MKLRYQTVILLFIASLAMPAAATDQEDPLQFLEPLVGERWVGHFRNMDDGPPLIFQWESILDGQAIRFSRTVPERDFRAESTIYWDEQQLKVAYLSLTNNGYVSHGTVVLEGDRIIVAGDQMGPAGAKKVRAAFWIDAEGRLNNELHNWENGRWEPAHTTFFERER